MKYKGFDIEYNFYGTDEYSVQIEGDDVIVRTVSEAKKVINEYLEHGNESEEMK